MDWCSIQNCTTCLCPQHRFLSLWNVKLWLVGWFSWRYENYFEIHSSHIIALMPQEISGVQCITFWNFLEQKSGYFYDFALLPRPFLHALMCFNNEYPILVLFIPFCLSPRGYWQWQLNVNEFATFAEFAWKCKLVCCFVFPIQFNTLIEGSYSFWVNWLWFTCLLLSFNYIWTLAITLHWYYLGCSQEILTLFSKQCHNCNENWLINMQKDVLKLFDAWMNSYLFLVRTWKSYKAKK